LRHSHSPPQPALAARRLQSEQQRLLTVSQSATTQYADLGPGPTSANPQILAIGNSNTYGGAGGAPYEGPNNFDWPDEHRAIDASGNIGSPRRTLSRADMRLSLPDMFPALVSF
jgi:hypothetical protein